VYICVYGGVCRHNQTDDSTHSPMSLPVEYAAYICVYIATPPCMLPSAYVQAHPPYREGVQQPQEKEGGSTLKTELRNRVQVGRPPYSPVES
jgi:hypothetical protein